MTVTEEVQGNYHTLTSDSTVSTTAVKEVITALNNRKVPGHKVLYFGGRSEGANLASIVPVAMCIFHV